MKMERGELIGFNRCLGYNYNVINECIDKNIVSKSAMYFSTLYSFPNIVFDATKIPIINTTTAAIIALTLLDNGFLG